MTAAGCDPVLSGLEALVPHGLDPLPDDLVERSPESQRALRLHEETPTGEADENIVHRFVRFERHRLNLGVLSPKREPDELAAVQGVGDKQRGQRATVLPSRLITSSTRRRSDVTWVL